jgi:2-polyprenyl-3-methyl-5-hydroxy-6-metoxy-1,4-benzoquinol methylase
MTQLLDHPETSTLASEAVSLSEAVERPRENCVLCGEQSRMLFPKYGVWIRECQACSHRFAVPEQQAGHVETHYDDDYFFGGGAGYDDYLSEAALLTAHGRRYARILSRFTTPGRLLDVGAAAGFVLNGFAEAGWEGHGIEPNATMARHGREQLNLDVACGTLEDMPADSQFDVVSMIQVVAHFLEPQEATRRVAELVRPGGLCLVETWNVRSWSARLFGQNWHEYSPPSVLQWYSPATLSQLFASHGFEQIARGRPAKKISIGHARSLLEHGQERSIFARVGASVLKYLPGDLTLPYPSEDLFWMVFRRV